MSILDCRFFPFIPLNISRYSVLACRVSAEKSVDRLVGVPLYITCGFSLAAFNILSVSLILAILSTMCLGVILSGLILFGTLCFLNLDVCFLCEVRKFSAITSSNMLSAPFSLLLLGLL